MSEQQDDIEMLKAKLAEHEQSISKHEQDRIDHSGWHKFLIFIILVVLGGAAIYFTGYWPEIVKLYYRSADYAMGIFLQVKAALTDLQNQLK